MRGGICLSFFILIATICFEPTVSAQNSYALKIDEIDLKGATLSETIKFLRKKAMGKVNFVLQANQTEIPIELHLYDVGIYDAVRYVCMSAGIKYKIVDNTIIVGGNLEKYPGPELPDKKGDADSTMLQRLHSIKIPSINFSDSDMQTCVEYLRFSSKKYDGKKQGVNFVLLPDMQNMSGLTLLLDDVSLYDAVKYLSTSANLDLRIESGAVVFLPKENKEKKKTEK